MKIRKFPKLIDDLEVSTQLTQIISANYHKNEGKIIQKRGGRDVDSTCLRSEKIRALVSMQ